MITLAEIAQQIVPRRTVLFLGAGASVPSGGPTSQGLARHLEQTLARGEVISDELRELCTILEDRYGRPALVGAIRDKLRTLSPAGGLLALPEYDWKAIYTTNFDTLVEAAFSRCQRDLVPIVSNYDYGKIEGSEGIPLLKLHGCISTDVVDGHRARILLTERDYDAYRDYRQVLLQRLSLDMHTKDVLVVGHSLRDPHLRSEVNEAARLHQEAGAPGRLLALVYEGDPDRARILESKGIQVACGGIDELMDALSKCPAVSPARASAVPEAGLLPLELRSCTMDVAQEAAKNPNVSRLFNGSPATYADIATGVTFGRSVETRLLAKATAEVNICMSILGVAGVGKTTLARRLAYQMCQQGMLVWEHNADFPLKSGAWVQVESLLRQTSAHGVLLVDDAPTFMRQINMLADGLGRAEDPRLRLLLVAETSQWVPRTKSPIVFRRGHIEWMTQLDEADIDALLNLLAQQQGIRQLVDPSFAHLSRQLQKDLLTRKCRADMYVSLKHIFSTEGLDEIILREYARLSEDLQDIYRTVAALEAAGTRVHRQLVLRLLGVPATILSAHLATLEGLVDEYDIFPDDGIFGWRTRHEVIAETLTRYKYADQDQLFSLLTQVIGTLNPTVWLELRTLSDLCNSKFGIQRLADPDRKQALYTRLIDKAPGERIPRHRLIAELLHSENLSAAEQAIVSAERSVGLDSPIHRYKVLLHLRRARGTEGLLEEDRRALVLEARRLAHEGIRRFPKDKYAYTVFEDVGRTFYELTKDPCFLDEAISVMRKGYEETFDPDLASRLRTLERERPPLGEPPPAASPPGPDSSG